MYNVSPQCTIYLLKFLMKLEFLNYENVLYVFIIKIYYP